jgi:hydroxymethylpyrimidine pyrophosphatase-like HAD family hydrolase
MRYLVLVTDYDGTLAMGGKADESTLSALERLRMSGRRAILLTGRQLDDLLTVCPKLSVFDYVVAENGAVLYEPRTRQQTLLGKPPPARFLRRLRELTGNSIGVGKVIVDTRVPPSYCGASGHSGDGPELQIVFNDDSVMVLPTGE